MSAFVNALMKASTSVLSSDALLFFDSVQVFLCVGVAVAAVSLYFQGYDLSAMMQSFRHNDGMVSLVSVCALVCVGLESSIWLFLLN